MFQANLIEVLHESQNFSKAEPKSLILAEDHDLSEADGAALVDVDLVEELLECNLQSNLKTIQ